MYLFIWRTIVADANANTVGQLRRSSSNDIQIVRAIEEIQLVFALHTYDIAIMLRPVRNRYSGNQRCDMYIEVKAQDLYRTSVETYLNDENISYQVQYL